MTVVACLHHLDTPVVGHAEAPLRAAGLELTHHRVPAGDPLPRLEDVDAIVAFGGAQSAVDLAAQPALQAEATLLAAAVERDVPVLGICLGAQLLAHGLGAAVRKAPARTVAWLELERLPAAAGDPIAAALPERVWALHWNEDVFDLPAGAVELLGPRREGVEAFRVGRRAWGVQFHPEVDPPTLEHWYATYGDWVAEAGTTAAAASAADAVRADDQAELARRLFGAFAVVVDA